MHTADVLVASSLMSPSLEGLSALLVYAIVWGFVFVESGILIGFFLPGDSLLFAAGLISAAPNSPVDIRLLAAGTFIAAIAGDQVGYLTGRKLGRPYLEHKTSPRLQRHLDRTEQFYARYGWWAVVIARFIPWVRTFTPIVAGIGRMNYRRFLGANVTGAVCWGIGITTLGYFAASIPAVKSAAYAIAGFFIVASFVSAIRLRMIERRAQSGDVANTPSATKQAET
jgi:membrane-associated protein